MEWIVYAIWFGCGYMCREVILQKQYAKAKLMLDEMDKRIKEDLGIDINELRHNTQKERANGNNKHSK